jgi:uncharacterized protein YidB (DUF937 family)
MRLLHEVYQELGDQDGDLTPLGAVLEDLLGGPRGTLPNLADRFTQAGLGGLMASWISDGPNLPITPTQLRTVLGGERTRDFATAAGLSEDDLLRRLAGCLPRVIDRMTPDGHVQERENPATFPT